MYEGHPNGFGIKLTDWRNAIVMQDDGNLAYDNFGGEWGNPADLERLRIEYLCQLAEQNATAQGWQCERNDSGLIVHLPGGQWIELTAELIDAARFPGRRMQGSYGEFGPSHWPVGTKA